MDTKYASLIEGTQYVTTLLANTSAYLYESLSQVNWVGFYLFTDNQLVLGPFQGKVACEIIQLNRGVCGKAATDKQVVVVADVHQFVGHIACDSSSQSEIVLPIIINDELFGLLDIDSQIKNRFSELDEVYLKTIVFTLQEKLKQLI